MARTRSIELKTGAWFVAIFMAILAVWSAPAFSSGAPAKAAKARIVDRLDVVLDLKSRGIVGENNRGYLELLKSAGERYKGVVEAENRDRRIIYQYIASSLGVPLETVERRRARQIRERAATGQWLQDDTGRWYQKP